MDLSELLSYYAKHGYTLAAMMQKYAPSADHNNPDAYAKFLAEKCGCQIDTPVSQLMGATPAA